MPAAVAARSDGGNRHRDALAQRRRRDEQEEHARPEDDAERDRPRHAAADDQRVGEERVQAHARRDAEGQPRVEPHQQRHREAHEHGGGERAGEGNAGAGRRQDRRVHDDDVGHREEGRDAGDDLAGIARSTERAIEEACEWRSTRRCASSEARAGAGEVHVLDHRVVRRRCAPTSSVRRPTRTSRSGADRRRTAACYTASRTPRPSRCRRARS